MILLILILVLLIILALIITPVIWCGFGKLFRIDDLTFKKALLACLLITLIGVAFQIITVGLAFLKLNNVIFDLILSIAGLVLVISIIKVRLDTTILKSIGLYVSTIIFVICLALLIRTFIVQAYKIPSGAMKHSILVGDHILVNKFIYASKKPQRGDIIVFKYPVDLKKDFIKRVVGLPGDTIEGRDKIIYVNNESLEEPYAAHTDPHIYPKGKQERDNFGPITVPENAFFVMGDNRDQSFDSRYWGFVDRKSIKGKAFVIYWSQDKENRQVRWDRIGKPL
jgi:signal peptidase I